MATMMRDRAQQIMDLKLSVEDQLLQPLLLPPRGVRHVAEAPLQAEVPVHRAPAAEEQHLQTVRRTAQSPKHEHVLTHKTTCPNGCVQYIQAV
mmetsp:Transcript_69722/g.130158  ORF Transcript_69722/g.130158 Transcript_69722/m.130158 type:complete len:93 (-) Transcript_69722:14-292(-)